MEYRVTDLIRVLVKKWYVILIIMALIGGASLFTANWSYKKAVEQYNTLT